MQPIASALLRKKSLKNTLPRQAVVNLLAASKKPLSIAQILEQTAKSGSPLNMVSVYRIMEAFEKARMIHRYQDGTFSLCALDDLQCHHVLLHCNSCGDVRETHDHNVCREERSLTKRYGFTPQRHGSEILGICSKCA